MESDGRSDAALKAGKLMERVCHYHQETKAQIMRDAHQTRDLEAITMALYTPRTQVVLCGIDH